MAFDRRADGDDRGKSVMVSFRNDRQTVERMLLLRSCTMGSISGLLTITLTPDVVHGSMLDHQQMT